MSGLPGVEDGGAGVEGREGKQGGRRASTRERGRGRGGEVTPAMDGDEEEGGRWGTSGPGRFVYSCGRSFSFVDICSFPCFC